MRYSCVFGLLLFCFIYSGSLSAQTTTEGLPGKWSLQDCFDYAKKNNIQLQLLNKNIDLSLEDLEQAKAARLPGLSFASTQALANYNNSIAGVVGSQDRSGFISNYSLNSSLVLYEGGSIKNDIHSKQITAQQSSLSLQQASNDIVLQITQVFLSILVEKEFVIADQNLVETSKQQYQQAKDRFNAGSIAKKDLVQLEASLATDEYNLVQAQNLVRQYTVQLKQVLQLPFSYTLEVKEPDSSISFHEIRELQEVESIAEHTRPEILNGKLAVQQADLQLKQAYSAKKPSVVMSGSVNSGYTKSEDLKYFNQVSNDLYENIALTIAFPIFSNRINKTRIEKSRIEIAQSQLSLKNVSTQLSQQVEQAYINLVNAASQFSAAQTQLKANEENFRISQEQLKLGAIDPVSFQVQKSLYLQAVEANIQAKYNTLLNQGIYEYYMGKPIVI